MRRRGEVCGGGGGSGVVGVGNTDGEWNVGVVGGGGGSELLGGGV